MKRASIQFKIPLFILIFSLSCIILTALIFQVLFQRKLESNMMTKNMIISEMISKHIDQYIEDARDTLVTASNFSSASFGDLGRIEEEIFRIYDNFAYFDLIFYMNSDAQMVFSKPDNTHVKGRDYRDRSYYWDIVRDQKSSTISPLLLSSVLEEPHFIIAGPVYAKNRDIIGLIGAGLPLNNLEGVIAETQANFEGNIWIVDEAGTLVLHPDIDTTQELVPIERLNIDKMNLLKEIMKKGSNTTCNYLIDGKKQYSAVSFPQGTGWMIVVEQEEQALFSDIFALQSQMIKLVLGFSLLAILVGLLIARSITKPIARLVKSVRGLSDEIHEGDETVDKIMVEDELEELNHAFNEMSTRLKQTLQKLTYSLSREMELQQYLNDILRSVKLGILVVNRSKTITVCNREAEQITQYGSSDFVHYSISQFIDQTQLAIETYIDHVLTSDHNYQDMNLQLTRKDGVRIPVQCTFSKVLDEHMATIGVVIQFRDMTRIMRIEEELRRGDRIRTIGELSAGIIHDLGNPLAGMSSLIEILQLGQCDHKTRDEILNVLNEEVHDLNELVINFLEFTKHASLDKHVVNLVQLLDHILGVLKHDLMDKEIQLIKTFNASQVLISIDRNLMKQVFYNVLGNAIQALDKKGMLTIELVEEGHEIQLTIKDNGVGMTPAEMEQIYSPFFTTKEDGNGLGMFISYNIIKEHEGRLLIESEKGFGTTVQIILPKSEVMQ